MKYLSTHILLAGTLLLGACLMACSEDLTQKEQTPHHVDKMKIEITVDMPSEADTRLEYEEEGGTNKYTLKWQKGDVIKVIGTYSSGPSDPNPKHVVTELTTEDDNVTSARFKGEVPLNTSQLAVIYAAKNIRINGNSIRMDYSGQFVDDVNRTQHIKDYLYLRADPTSVDEFQHLQLKMLNGLIRFEVPQQYPFNTFKRWSLRWVVNHKTLLERDTDVEFQTNPNATTDYIYLCFDPKEMRLYKGQDVAVYCHGYSEISVDDIKQNVFDQYLKLHSVNGKEYLPSHRYQMKLSEVKGAKWVKYTDKYKAITVNNGNGEGYPPFWVDLPPTTHTKPWDPNDYLDYLGCIPPSESDTKMWEILTKFSLRKIQDNHFRWYVDVEDNILGGFDTYFTTLYLPEGIEVIGQFAYANNFCLEEIVLPRTLKKIEMSAFDNCKNLKKVTFTGESTTPLEIDGSAFAKCYELVEITIPNRCKAIGSLCFMDCKKLKTVHYEEPYTSSPDPNYVPKTLPLNINPIAFDGCDSLTNNVFPPRCTNKY